MPKCTNQCSTSLTTQAIIACGNYKKDNAPAIGLLFCEAAYTDFEIDMNAETTTLITPLVAVPNDFLVLKKGNLEYDVEPISDDSPVAGETSYQSGIKMSFTFTDPNVRIENVNLYKNLIGRKAYLVVAYTNGYTEVSEVMFNLESIPAGQKRDTTRANILKGTALMPRKDSGEGRGMTYYDWQPPAIFGIEGI